MNQSQLPNLEEKSSLESDQKSAKYMAKEAVTESEVLLIQYEKYNTKISTQK